MAGHPRVTYSTLVGWFIKRGSRTHRYPPTVTSCQEKFGSSVVRPCEELQDKVANLNLSESYHSGAPPLEEVSEFLAAPTFVQPLHAIKQEPGRLPTVLLEAMLGLRARRVSAE